MVKISAIAGKTVKRISLSLIQVVLLIALLNSTFTVVFGQSDDPEYWAIIVGVDDYPSPNFNTEYCAKNANDLAQILKPFYSDDHITLLTGENATKTAVLDEISNLSDIDSIEDTVLFYFAGHGAARGHYMCTYDPPREMNILGYNVYGRITNPTKWISPGELGNAMNNLNSERIFVVLDMCDAGGFGDKLLDERMTILCSSAVGKESWASEGLEGGIFSHYFLEEINEFIEGSASALSLEDIYGNVVDPIKSYFRDEYYGYYEEIPQLIDNDDEEAVILERFVIDSISIPLFFIPPIIIDDHEYSLIPDDLIWVPHTLHTIEFPLYVDIPGGDSYLFVSCGGDESPVQTITSGCYQLEYGLLPDADVYSQFEIDAIEICRGQSWFWGIYTALLGYPEM